MTLQEKIEKIVKNWYGKGKDLECLTIHNLICALDQAKCDVANDTHDSDPVIPLMISKVLDTKLINLVSNIKNYPLNEGLGTVEQIYLLFRPKHDINMNRLFVVTKTPFGYNLGVDYNPECGNWGHGHYNGKSVQDWEDYIREEYGAFMPLLKKED